jgi:hypothetical protein
VEDFKALVLVGFGWERRRIKRAAPFHEGEKIGSNLALNPTEQENGRWLVMVGHGGMARSSGGTGGKGQWWDWARLAGMLLRAQPA